MLPSGYRYTYGPVPSRRLGSSLGVDLVPFKICTYDCIYCQLGRTTNKTIERKEYIPTEKIIAEIRKRLSDNLIFDFITLAGSGEPTLHSNIGRIIQTIKSLTSIPIAVITNGSLLSETEVQDALMKADLIIPSLDAGSEDLFQKVNRPHRDLDFNSMINGMCEFRNRFNKSIWLEVFLISKVNDPVPEIEKIASLVSRINPDKVQLNTVARPPAEEYAQPISTESLMAIKNIFKIETEVINGSKSNKLQSTLNMATKKDEILTLLKRRPCTARNIADGLGMSVNEVIKQLDLLLKRDITAIRFGNDRLFYKKNRA